MKHKNSTKVLEHVKQVVRNNEHCCVLIFLAFATWILHKDALNGFWRFDDGEHLLFAATYAPWQYFFLPSITLLQSYANVTPYNVFFYDVNLALFGIAPQWHYAHQLALLGTVAFATYRFIRLWQEPFVALLAAMLFLLGLPTLHVAQQLMTGHYATGLLFTVLSLHCYVVSVREARFRLALLGAVFYLLATSCKEVFVPLVLLLPFLPVGTSRTRLRASLPYVFVAALYTAWRYVVLGRLVGGYITVETTLVEQLRQLLSIPLLLMGWTRSDELGLFFSRQYGLNFAAAVGIVVLGLIAAIRRRFSWLLIFSAVTLLVLPLVPLTRSAGLNFADRYLFLVWWACTVLLAIIVSGLKTSGIEAALRFVSFVMLIGLAFTAQQNEQKRLYPELVLQDSVYRAAMYSDNHTALLLPPNQPHYKTGLAGARQVERMLVDSSFEPAKLIVDTAMLCASTKAGNKILAYDETCHCMKDVTKNIETSSEKLISFADHAVPGKPFNVAISLDHQLLSWKLGPYDSGSYSVILGGTATNIPARGSTRYGNKLPLRFRIRHESREGEMTISPTLEFDMSKHSTFAWTGVSEVVKPLCDGESL